jgi:hypothetical protein
MNRLLGIGALVVCLIGLAQAEIYEAGTTYWDDQYVGGSRLIACDDSAYIHFVWTRLPSVGQPRIRHIFYNRWNPQTSNFESTTGIQLNPDIRSGFPSLAVDAATGCPMVAFHQILTNGVSTGPAVSVCGDLVSLLPGESVYDRNWPQMARDPDGTLHLVCIEYPYLNEGPYQLLYARGIPHYDNQGNPSDIEWLADGGSIYRSMDTTGHYVSQAIACSRQSARVAIAWVDTVSAAVIPGWERTIAHGNILLRLSSDGGDTWGDKQNLTQFDPPDPVCYEETHDWRRCDRDTISAVVGLSTLFDAADQLHMVFTTSPLYFWIDSSGAAGPWNRPGAAEIWHWSEATGQFSLVAADWLNSVWIESPRIILSQPSLALDPETGYLYCAYAHLDTGALSTMSFCNSDLWVSVSTNGGADWSVGTNVTHTRPEVLPAPAGQCLSEEKPSLAETVQDGFLHLAYILDRDAGSYYYNQGVATLNSMIYQRIPVDSIATTPLLPRYPLHWDSSGFASAVPPSSESASVKSLELGAPFPNPFNSQTWISYSLPRAASIRLSIYDLLGREVAVLNEGLLDAGSHRVVWNAKAQASGVYFVCLRHGNDVQTQKVLLLK